MTDASATENQTGSRVDRRLLLLIGTAAAGILVALLLAFTLFSQPQAVDVTSPLVVPPPPVTEPEEPDTSLPGLDVELVSMGEGDPFGPLVVAPSAEETARGEDAPAPPAAAPPAPAPAAPAPAAPASAAPAPAPAPADPAPLSPIGAPLVVDGPLVVEGPVLVDRPTAPPPVARPGIVAVDDVLVTYRNVPGSVDVLANDTGAGLSVVSWTEGTHGSVQCAEPGLCTYIPGSDFVGDDSFTYVVSDSHGGTSSATVAVTVRLRATVADFTGDGVTDLAVYRPSTRTWHIRGVDEIRYGARGDVPVPGDYTGDGVTDVAVYRPSTGWWLIRGHGVIRHGTSGDVPVPGDYTGDGVTDLAVYRPSTGTWHIRGVDDIDYGARGDVPVPGDYTGGGVTDLAVYRPSTGNWHIRGVGATRHGVSGDVPVPGDYTGDGVTDLAVYRPSTGEWLVHGQKSGASHGGGTDIPLPLPHAIYRYYFGGES